MRVLRHGINNWQKCTWERGRCNVFSLPTYAIHCFYHSYTISYPVTISVKGHVHVCIIYLQIGLSTA